MKIIITLIFLILSSSCLDFKKNTKEVIEVTDEINQSVNIKSQKTTRYSAGMKFGEVVKVKWEDSSEEFYDKKGKIIKKLIFDEDGTLSTKEIYHYDVKEKLIEMIYIFEGKEIARWDYSYEYDEIGNEIKFTDKSIEGTFERKEIIKYDKNGNILEVDVFTDKNTRVQFGAKIKNEYNHYNNLIKVKEYMDDGSLSYTTTFKYDEGGDLIEKYSYSEWSDYLNLKFKYEYNSKNNWIKKIEYKDGELNTVTYRKIEFY